MRLRIALAVWIVMGSAIGFAEGTISHAKDPETLLDEISTRSAAAVLAEVAYGEAWQATTTNVATGERAWLLVALALMPTADGGTSDDLRLAVNRALVTNPSGVLELFLSQEPPPEVCWATAEFGGHETVESAIAELNAKVKALQAVTEPALSRQRDRCITKLREAEPRLYGIYGKARPTRQPAAQQGDEVGR